MKVTKPKTIVTVIPSQHENARGSSCHKVQLSGAPALLLKHAGLITQEKILS